MRAIVSTTLLAFLLAGCSSRTPDATVKADNTPSDSRRAAPKATMPSSDFDKARQSFQAYAVKQLGVAANALIIAPIEAHPNVQFPQKVGAISAFSGTVKADRQRFVRGWAVADGRVITPEQNVELLFKEAGFFGDNPTLTAEQMAERLTWAIPNGALEYGTFEKASGGGGTFTYLVMAQEPPMGAMPGPPHYYEYKITLGTDGKAVIKKRQSEGSPPLP